MGVPLVIRASAFLLVLLVVLDPALGRSMSQGDEGEDNRHHRHRHLTQPGSQLQDPVRYDVGTPETAVKTGGPQDDPPAPHNPPPAAKWEVISQAAQNIGRAVSLFSPAKHGSYVKDVPHDDDDDDDDDDNDDDDSDDDDVHSLQEPHDQVDLEDRGDDVDTASSHHDVYSDEEILKITGTPSPALITSEEDEQLIPETHVPEQLMRDDSAAAEQLLRTEGAQPKKAFKPVRMPTRFESYDLEPKDGFVTLQELVNITGARVNVQKAFNASDKNGDGLLDRREFYSAPWKLGPNWRYIPIDPDEENSSHEEDEEEDDDEYDEDDYDDDDMDDYDDDDWDEWDKWEDEDSDLWDDMDDVDIF